MLDLCINFKAHDIRICLRIHKKPCWSTYLTKFSKKASVGSSIFLCKRSALNKQSASAFRGGTVNVEDSTTCPPSFKLDLKSGMVQGFKNERQRLDKSNICASLSPRPTWKTGPCQEMHPSVLPQPQMFCLWPPNLKAWLGELGEPAWILSFPWLSGAILPFPSIHIWECSD